jgi:hypothetical protein
VLYWPLGLALAAWRSSDAGIVWPVVTGLLLLRHARLHVRSLADGVSCGLVRLLGDRRPASQNDPFQEQ